ncbi:MAG: hypothetical protein IT536_03555 [Hyphomicrobiales bacterium]|nr:hypothetical protein [Hyphomicrobiales bacterium]
MRDDARSMGHVRCNLVLVLWSEHARTKADLIEIARRVSEIDPAIRTRVVTHHKLDQLRLFGMWTQPTLSLSLYALEKRKLLPGRLATGRRLAKHGEYSRLDDAGIPVPRWSIISPDLRLDPLTWGPYVVVKPSAGRLGAQVRIQKTTRVHYRPADSFPDEHYGRQGPMLVQQFIYTGEWPTSYRVVTLFGEVLLCYRQVTRTRGYPLRSRFDFTRTGGISIVSNTKDMEVTLTQDAEVIALAERAHREAFPDFPILSFDIVRDADTANLYVLECHSHGSWFFSADIGVGIETANKLDFKKQFDALGKAARILARETPIRAAARSPFHAAAAS